jgi:hypothetical protein
MNAVHGVKISQKAVSDCGLTVKLFLAFSVGSLDAIVNLAIT